MPVKGGPNIQTAQALVFLDSADKLSYPGTGTTWVNSVSPGTFNGTLANGVGFNSTDALGALVFTSSNSYIDVGNIGTISSSFTFQVAVKPFPTSSGGVYTILSYTSGSGTGSLTFKLDYSSSSQIATLSTSISSDKVYNLTASVSTGSWSILHGVYNGGTFSFYKNGTKSSEVATTGSTVVYTINNKLLIGGISQFTGSYLSGSIANVVVYNSELGKQGIISNYNGLATRFGLPNIPATNVRDNDARAFIEAAGIVSDTQIEAIDTLVINLKSYGLWTKMKAIYPMVGGTATSHRFNLKDPRNVNAAFRLTFNGGWTHSQTGAQPNGTNAYAETYLNLSTTLTNRNVHFSHYSRAGSTGNEVTLIGTILGQSGGAVLYNIYSGQRVYATLGGAYTDCLFGNLLAFHLITSLDGSTNGQRVYSNGVLKGSSTNNSTSLANTTAILSGGYAYSPYQIAFASIGDGLTDTEAVNFSLAVQNFQTTLGRQV
jgi:hypothetical protein